METENFLILLRCLARGHKRVLYNWVTGQYSSLEFDSLAIAHESAQYSIESRICFEIYGEYPLSGCYIKDWELVKKAFNLPS